MDAYAGLPTQSRHDTVALVLRRRGSERGARREVRIDQRDGGHLRLCRGRLCDRVRWRGQGGDLFRPVALAALSFAHPISAGCTRTPPSQPTGDAAARPATACEEVRTLQAQAFDAYLSHKSDSGCRTECVPGPDQCLEAGGGGWGVVVDQDCPCEAQQDRGDYARWHLVYVPGDAGTPRTSASLTSHGLPTLSLVGGRLVVGMKHCPTSDETPCADVSCLASATSGSLLDCLDGQDLRPPAWISGAVETLEANSALVVRMRDGRWTFGPHLVAGEHGEAFVELRAMQLDAGGRYAGRASYLAGLPIRGALGDRGVDFDDPTARAWDEQTCGRFPADDRVYDAPAGTPRNLLKCMRPKVPTDMSDLWLAALCWRLNGTPLAVVAERWKRRCLVIDIPDCDPDSGPQLQAICQVDGAADDTQWTPAKIGMPEHLKRALQRVTPRREGR